MIRKLLLGILILAAGMSIGWMGRDAYAAYTTSKHASVNTTKEAATPESEVAALQASIASLLANPPAETPALLTVTDTSKLTTDFLRQSQPGDKVLLYNDSKKVIIFRPTAHKIVDIGPLTITPVQ